MASQTPLLVLLVLAVNLAALYCRNRERLLLNDLDFRRPRVGLAEGNPGEEIRRPHRR